MRATWARAVVAALAVNLGAAVAAPPDADPAARGRVQELLERAMKSPRDAALLASTMEKLDAEAKASPGQPIVHYARGWVLSALGRKGDAVAAYDRAGELAPRVPDAFYNAGVVLVALGRVDEALLRFGRAIAADPKHLDALYNSGQLRYDRREFEEALKAWSRAREIAPEDFDVAKKVLQAQNALGDRKAAAKAREEVIELWRRSKDPRLRGMKDFAFDLFDVGRVLVVAYETFEPQGDLIYLYTCRVFGADRQLAGSVNVESSSVIREMGVPWVLGVSRPGQHKTLDRFTWKERPAWEQLRPTIEKVVAAEFAGP